MAKFFQPSVDCVVQAVVDQEKTALHKISVSKKSNHYHYQPV